MSLLDKDALYLVALSGGADSVCLLCCLYRLGYRVEAVHCNFGLRGRESDRDELFCKHLCHELEIPLHLVHFDTAIYAKMHHVSIEMAARELRYSYFKNLCNDVGAAGVCVGHHQGDSVETILLNLVRSTGIHGLTGISPKNDYIYRPLLCVSRSEIISYLRFIQQDYITDSTNLIADVQRNKMRLKVIPQMENINPSVQQNILKTAARLSDVVGILDDLMRDMAQWKQAGQYLCFPLKDIKYEYQVWYLLKDYQFSPAQAEQIFHHRNNGSGRVWCSQTHELLIDREQMFLAEKIALQRKELMIPEPGIYVYDDTRKVSVSLEDLSDKVLAFNDKSIAFIDLDKMKFPLKLRLVQSADRFQPFGMKGTKLLSDYMTDKKMSLFDKRQQLVLADANGDIVWVVNERLADFCKITHSTRAVLKVQMLQY